MDIGVKLGLTCKAATSTACQWNSVFRKELEPMTVSQLQPLIKRSRTKPVPSVIPTSKDSLQDQSVLEALKKVCPDAVFFTTIPRLDPEETETASEEGDFQRCVQPLRDLYREHASDSINTETAKNIWNNYKCTETQAKDLEKETRGQSVCPLWFEQRKGRITATKAHDVLAMKQSTSPDNLVRRITGSKCYNLSGKAAVKWGTTNELTARTNYIMNERGNHQYLHVTTPGLMVDHRKPFLAVSSDGCVSCDCCSKRLLEIKCPYKHKDKNVSQIKDKDFCLDAGGNLKQNHRYYTQIQIQMYVYNVQRCDLFIYTSKDSATVTVSRSEPFCEEMVRKCEQFFLRFVLPELVTRRLENTPVAACQVVSIVNKSNSSDEKKVWCLCEEPEYGRMIQCVNEDCPTQWFHYECVNIRRCPKGKWVCPECSDIKD